jgi:hypothetical protein
MSAKFPSYVGFYQEKGKNIDILTARPHQPHARPSLFARIL